MFYDLTLDQLKKYKPKRNEPKDFDNFWNQSLIEVRKYPLNESFKKVDFGLKLVDTYDVTFNGFNGNPIKGWFVIPKNTIRKIPCIVEFIGYGGGRSYPIDWLLWSNTGYAHFIMDTRGQGSVWSKGDTPDPEIDGSNPQTPGFMTKGILSQNTYYYRRVFIDAVRAVEAAFCHPLVDQKKIILTGGSQGGGITLAAAGLMPDIFAVMPDVPFLCHFRVATQLVDTNPYFEISQFCKIHRDKIDTIFNTLSYFDGINFAARTKSHAFFSVGLMDNICPPRTVFAAYNHYSGPKEIKIWEYNNHEGGGSMQNLEKMNFLNRIIPKKG